ncbi:MAG TPA: hypothetical protein VIC33_09620 [Vicinamibacterales bacterium]|jgi:hypothetical protein
MIRWAVYARLLGIATAPVTASRSASLKKDLVFLTRDGCVNTAKMRKNLDEALHALRLPCDYTVVNIGTLKKSDARTGYPTPTVLYHDKDIFGLHKPTPPIAEPT